MPISLDVSAFAPIGFGSSARATPPNRTRQAKAGVRRSSPATGIRPLWVSSGAVAVDIVVIAAATVLARLAYGDDTPVVITVMAGASAAALFVAINLARRDYAVWTMLNTKGSMRRAATNWILAVGLALTVGFLTKTTAVYSRGANALLFAGGLAAVSVARVLLVRHAQRWAAAGRLVVKRIMLVGGAQEITEFMARYQPEVCGLKLVSAAVLRDERGAETDDLALAVATARMHRPDDLFLLLPWDDQALVVRTVDMLQRLPAAIHLGPTALLERYRHLRIEQAGSIASVRLIRRPLSPTDLRLKRAFDLVVASTALLILGPVFILIALAIKIDSPGPALFRQRRTGFNQQPFRIFKFRSMRTMEDSAALRQVTSRDARVTRLGWLLRRTSLDELPQLINVIRGEMSLIGPRPHALAHDQEFGRSHALYARRHNMRPGITGWAQVSGFRGETDTPEKIAGRVWHDLDYIDNWSIWLDLRILLRTVFSPKTFRNAK